MVKEYEQDCANAMDKSMSEFANKTVVALCTCHNRKNKTLKAITSLVESFETCNLSVNIVCVLDNCTDGTFSELSSLQFKGNIELILIEHFGDDLYWAGGMRFGFKEINKKRLSYDYLFAFNDDVLFEKDALLNMLEYGRGASPSSIIVGPLYDGNNSPVYGGKRRHSILFPLRYRVVSTSGSPEICDTLNMNGALIPAALLSSIGFLSSQYRHTLADYDYGHRVIQFGGSIISIPQKIGSATLNNRPKSVNGRMQQIRDLNNSIIHGSASERYYYYTTWGGIRGFFYFLVPYIKILIRGFK